MVGVSSQWVAITSGVAAKMPSRAAGSSTSMLPVLAPMNTLTPQADAGSTDLMASRLSLVAPQVEGVICSGNPGGPGVLVVQRCLVDGQRVAVGHFHVAGDAPGHGGGRLGGDGALVGEARFAEVGLVVDHAGQQPGAPGIEDIGPAPGRGADGGYAPVLQEHVALCDGALVDDARIDDALAGHGRSVWTYRSLSTAITSPATATWATSILFTALESATWKFTSWMANLFSDLRSEGGELFLPLLADGREAVIHLLSDGREAIVHFLPDGHEAIVHFLSDGREFLADGREAIVHVVSQCDGFGPGLVVKRTELVLQAGDIAFGSDLFMALRHNLHNGFGMTGVEAG